jgi:soluble lytic murein transglycosylase-like protein
MSNLYNTLYPYILTSTCLIGAYLAYKYRVKIIRLAVCATVLVACSAFVWAITREPEVIIESKIVEVQKGKENLEELLKEIPSAYGVPEIVVRSIVEQESGGNAEAIRFEASQMARASRISKNPEVQRMYASSHSFMQIMGWWSPEFGLKWTDLYDPRTNIEVGTTILKKCLDKSKAKTKYQKYYDALTCYNGSEKYAQAVMGSISRKVVEDNL